MRKDYKMFKEDIPFFVGLILFIGLFIVSIHTLINWTWSSRCQAISDNGTPSKWEGLVNGCFVKVNNNWIPKESWIDNNGK